MRLIGVVGVSAVVAASAWAGGVPQYTPEQFYKTVSIGGASFTPDESHILFSSDASGVFNVYSVPVAGGEPEQLTRSEDNATFSAGSFPHDDRLLFRADQGGNELYHLYVRDPDGTTHDLTPGEGVRALFAGWAGDLERFYVQTNERDPSAMDLYIYNSKTYERELVFENTEGWTIGPVSRDGRWLALDKTITNADSDVYIVDLEAGGDPELVTAHEGDEKNGSLAFTVRSTALLYLSDKDSEYQRAWSYDLRTGKHDVVAEGDWDVMYVADSWNGRYRVTAVNQDAQTVLTVEDRRLRKQVELPEVPGGDITGVRFSRSERYMAFYVNGDTSPSNLYVLDLQSGESRRLTDSMNPEIDEKNLVTSEVVRYPSFDGVEIPALLFKPKDASPQHRVPALVWVHGGPGGQSRKGYRADIQILANHGYAVLAVNNRGSSGYGKTFFHMDDRDHGGADLQDCVYGRKYLETLDWVDGGRVGIIGGSYGGYMVMAALCFEPQAFDVGIDLFGVTNWIRTLESIPPYWAAFRAGLYAEMGDPETDREQLEARSPLLHADEVVKPLLVVQGANDPRVMKAESDEIVAAVKGNGVPVEYVVFPDEGHGFLRKENRITAAQAYLDFLDQYLKAGPESKD